MRVVNHSLPYSRELDGLRGVAILLVLLFHFWPSVFSFGFVGVDIFFVLSGYLISKIILKKLQSNSFSLFQFYRNRIRRIFPTLIIVLSVTGVLGYLFLFPDELELLGKHTLSSSLFFQNINLSEETGYWDASARLKPLLHFWSLSIEEQFYLIWPLTLLLFYRLHSLILIGPLLLAFFFLSLNIDDEAKAFYLSYSRFWELMLGGLLARLEMNHCFDAIPRWTQFMGWGMLLLSLFLSVHAGNFNPLIIGLVVVATGVLIVASQQYSDNILASKGFHVLGLLSYPLYLWHYPLMSFSHIVGLTVAGLEFYLFVLSILLAWMSYRFIELAARRQQSWRFSGLLVVLVIVIGLIGGYVKNHDGLPDRSHILELEESAQQLKRRQAQDENCEKIVEQSVGEQRLFHYCRSSSSDVGANYVAIIGDSHAHAMYPGFASQLIPEGFEVLLMSNSGCPALKGGARGKNLDKANQCAKKIEQIFRILDRLPNVQKVIITTRGPTYSEESGFGLIEKKWTESPTHYADYYLAQERYDANAKYFQTVEQTFDYLTKQGYQVYYFLENPELGFHAKSCVDRPFGLVIGRCTVPYSVYQNRMARYREQSLALISRYAGVFALDPESLFCDEVYCYAKRDGQLMYADGDHLSVLGSHYVASEFVAKMIANGLLAE